jgi:ribosomal-protein-alanine N-acetyltransferase
MLPTDLPILRRGPVRLRAFRHADLDLVRSVADDPMIPLISTVPASGTHEEALAFVDRQHERVASGAGYSFAIADAETDEAAGQIGASLREHAFGRASVGYWVAPRYRRRGYVTAALDALSRWALELDGLARLELCVEPSNEGSWRAAERVGYRREGLLRGWTTIGDGRRDVYIYGLLRDDLPTGGPVSTDASASAAGSVPAGPPAG